MNRLRLRWRSRAVASVTTVVTMSAVMTTLVGCSAGGTNGSGTTGAGTGGTGTGGPASGSAAMGLARPAPPRTLVTGLDKPWAVAFLPGGDALVTERDSGRLLRVSPQGQVTVVGTVPGVSHGGEGGLLGVAVSPTYASDRFVYLYVTSASDNRVVRFPYTGRGGVAGLRPVLTGIPKGVNHNGGRLAFGPDGMLYVTTGETGVKPYAQERGSLGGKILRVTKDGRPAPGNPFGSPVWTYGHRNVQGIAWDRGRRAYATEFGQNTYDEINRILRGHNYGWPVVEGIGHDRRYTDPLLTWAPSEASPSGLAYARGSLWAGALRGQRLWQVPLRADGSVGRPIAHFTGRYGRMRAVVPAPDGSLWVTTDNGRGAGGNDKILVVRLS